MNNQQKICVFDIDGTLANIEHRRHHVQNGRRNWPAFNREMVNDKPHEDIIWLMQALAQRKDTAVVIASGRGEEDRAKTVEWLYQNRIVPHECPDTQRPFYGEPIFYHKLYMRPAKDSRKDSIIKREILDQIRAEFGEPYMVFDDRNQVVDMWRAEGIRCLQVAPGDF